MRFVIFFIILFTIKVNSQTTTICGTVNHVQTKKPIYLVNIWVKGTQQGTTTDINGHFCLEIDSVKENPILVFSEISYKQQTKEVSIKKDNNLNIFLSPSSIQLSEALVTASKNIKSIQEQTTIPTVVSKEVILENNTQNIAEILLRQPGVSLAGTGYHTAPSIRGLARKRVVVMLDGEKISSERNVGAPGTFINPFEVERIEILKGPYSTLYGSDAIGGVVNIISKQFDYPFYNEKIGGRVDLSYKSVNNGKNSNLALNGKIKKIQYRVSTGYREVEEYEQADGSKAFNSFFKEQYAAAKLKYSVNDKHQIAFKTHYSKGGPIGFPAHSTLVNAVHDYDNHFIVGLNYKINNNGKYLKKVELNMTRHTHDLGADIIVHKVENNPANDKRVSMRKDLLSNNYILQYDMYFTITDKLKVLTGFDGYFRENIDVKARKIVTNYNTGLFIMEVDDVSLENASQRSYGVFTQIDYAASNKVNVNAGIRWNNIATEQPNNSNFNKKSEAFSGNLGLSYSPTKEFSIKTNIGRAFRSPDIKELFVTTQTPGGMNISNPDLIPEHSLNLDLSFVYQGKSNLIQISTFRNQIDNMVLLDWDYTTNPRTGTYKNIGEALLYGIEFSYNQKITNNISSYFNLTNIYGKDINADDELMDVPPLQVNTGLRYRLNDNVRFNISGRHSSEQTNIAAGDYPTDAFTTFDFSTHWKIADNINANISITNVSNEYYREHFHFDWIRAAGRSFNAGINYNF